MKARFNHTAHNRAYIINTMFEDFQRLIPDEQIEASLVKLGIISAIDIVWLKQKFINENLTAKQCAKLAGCSTNHIQTQVKKYNLTKKRFGIVYGNNQAPRHKSWKNKIQEAQPHRKEVVVFNVGSNTPLLECPSISATAIKTGLRREYIRDCLNPLKQRNTANGLYFKYKDDYDRELRLQRAKNTHNITHDVSFEQLVEMAKD